jgi:hypothetical protein
LTTLSPHPKIRTGTPQNQKHRSCRFISTYKYRCLWYGLGSYSPELVNFSYVRSFPFPPNRTTRGLHEKINFERSSKPKPKHKNRVGISLSQSPYQTNNLTISILSNFQTDREVSHDYPQHYIISIKLREEVTMKRIMDINNDIKTNIQFFTLTLDNITSRNMIHDVMSSSMLAY